MSELRRRAGGRSTKNVPSPYEDDNGYYRSKTIVLSPLGALFLLFVIGLAFLLIGIYFNDRLPAVRPENDNRLDFIAQKALKNLNGLAEIGPKVTGSYENEVLAVNFITERIIDIMRKTSHRHNITYDLQKASGALTLSFLSKDIDLVYENVQNVIARIGPKSGSRKSLLLNCHYDSVPTSPGASDDGLNCVVMLEILRVLAISDEDLPHNVIFLFNGAEENPLLASHGFITQHKWAKEVQAFINLESCGAGGREVLFQAGPQHPWLIQSYRRAAKHPAGLVVAEEIFQSGLVPSDTDFRIFRDYGDIPGLDFAHCKNGFVYHTKYDNVLSIDNVLGVIQHTGDNMLSLTKALLNTKEFESPENFSEGSLVYYDVFGLFFLCYTIELGKALSSICVIIVIVGVYLTTYHQHSWNVLRSLYKTMVSSSLIYGTTILTLVYNLCLAHLLDLFGFSMSWYSNSIIIIPLYVIPAIVIMFINIVQFDKYDNSKTHANMRIKSQCLALLIFWTSLLFLSTFFNIRSAFLLLLLVLPPALYTLVTSLVHPTTNRISWSLIFTAITIPTSLYFTYLAVNSFRLFIPITGRAGAEKNPEFIISALASLFSIAVFSNISVIILMVKKRWVAINILIISHIFAIISIIMLPSTFPFSIGSPQRVLVTHVNRQFFDVDSLKRSDSLFWVQNMDRRGRKALTVLNDAPNLEQFCEKDGYCGLPWYSKFQESSASTCISSAPHDLNDETHLELVSKTHISKHIIRFDFNISGPNHMGLILTPSPSVTLKGWSLPRKIIKQPPYMVGYVHGLHNPLWNIWLEFEVQESQPKNYFKIEIYGLYFHHEKHFSQRFSDFILKFPQWAHVSPALSMYKSFLF